MAAIIAFMIITGMNGRPHVAKPTANELFVTRQNIATPQSRLRIVPSAIPREKQKRNFCRCSVPSPIMYAISGKDRINPAVGPVIACKPPVKFAKTGRPMAPKRTYTSVAINPFFEPRITPAIVTAKVCIVTGTPIGIGMDI